MQSRGVDMQVEVHGLEGRARADFDFEADGAQDTVCKPTLGAGTITAIRDSDQKGKSLMCLDVHTAMEAALQIEEVLTSAVQGYLGVTWKDCGAKHAKVDSSTPLSFATGSAATVIELGNLMKASDGSEVADV